MTSVIFQNINQIRNQIEAAVKNVIVVTKYPRLVAVSKTKSIDDIIEAYKAGLRYFGENYINELDTKSRDKKLLEECPDINWHFIGRIQSNKVKQLIDIPNLALVETVSSLKIADTLNKKLTDSKKEAKLCIMIQVNTSGEQVKNGIVPSDVVSICEHIVTQCNRLKLIGLMTIGEVHNSTQDSPNPDFMTLVKCRDQVCQSLNMGPGDLDLSMGMSGDFMHAIELGSTNVRVGSGIFGSRSMDL